MVVAPRVAVVVPTYQREALVERALGSVLAQEGTPFEVIVVDDGSTDGTAERLAALTDPRVRVISQANAGRGAARNAGARAATAPIVTFLDSDDEALPGWLAEIDRCIDPATCPVVRLAILVDRPGRGPQRCAGGTLDPHHPFPRGAGQPGSWAVSRELFLAVGGFDPALEFSENTDLLVRLALTAGREGWTAATSEVAGVVLHSESPLSRTVRYGSASRRAAETLLARYPAVLSRDRRTRQDYLAIVGVDELRAGRRASAAAVLARSWMARPASFRAAARLAAVVLPPGLRTCVERIARPRPVPRS